MLRALHSSTGRTRNNNYIISLWFFAANKHSLFFLNYKKKYLKFYKETKLKNLLVKFQQLKIYIITPII